MARDVFGDVEKVRVHNTEKTLDVDEVKEELRKVEGGETDVEDLDAFAHHSKEEIDCDLLDRMLRKFENKTLDFYAYARDTPKGKSTECKMLYARAKTISIPKFQMKAATSKYGKRYRDRRYKDTSLLFDETAFHRATRTEKEEEEEEEPLECIAIELVADRFLRKMVRCIVSTACREASSSLSSSKSSTKTRFSISPETATEWLPLRRRPLTACSSAASGTATNRTSLSSQILSKSRDDEIKVAWCALHCASCAYTTRCFLE